MADPAVQDPAVQGVPPGLIAEQLANPQPLVKGVPAGLTAEPIQAPAQNQTQNIPQNIPAPPVVPGLKAEPIHSQLITGQTQGWMPASHKEQLGVNPVFRPGDQPALNSAYPPVHPAPSPQTPYQPDPHGQADMPPAPLQNQAQNIPKNIPVPAVPQPATPPGAPEAVPGIPQAHKQPLGANPVYRPGENGAPNWLQKTLEFQPLPPLEQAGDWLDRHMGAGNAALADHLKAQRDAYDSNHPLQAQVKQGINEFLNGQTSVGNLALLAAVPQSRLISLLFTAQAAQGSYKSAEDAYQAHLKGDNPAAAKLATEAGLNGLMALMGLAHTADVRTYTGPMGEWGVRAGVGPVQAEVGRVPARRAPGPTGSYSPEEGSTVVPAQTTGRLRVGSHEFGTGAGRGAPPPAPEAAPPKELGAGAQVPHGTEGQGPEFRDQGSAAPPIGATEPETGRPVLQQSPHPEVSQAAATAEHPIVKSRLEDAIKPIEGAKISGARPEKDAERLDDKIETEGQSPRTVRDLSGFRIAVDTPAAASQVATALRGQFEVLSEQDHFDAGDPEHGFHALTLNVREPGSPVTHEVQILPREVADAADKDHLLYEKAREGDEQAKAKLKELNQQRWNEFQARQEEGSKKPQPAVEASASVPEVSRSGEAQQKPTIPTLKVKRAAALKETLGATDAYGQSFTSIFGDEDWQEMTEEQRKAAIESDFDTTEEEEREELERKEKDEEIDRDLDRRVGYMDAKQAEVEQSLKSRGLPYTAKGSSTYSRYITVDLPDDESITIRVSDHAPPVGRGGMKEGGYDYHDEADVSLHPGADALSKVEAKLPQKTALAQGEPKYKHGNTQANIPADSPASKAIDNLRASIPEADLAGDGRDVGPGGNHVTVRYGIKGDDTEGIRKFIESQPPFTARLGPSDVFPPSEHSDGAAVVHAPIESPELTRLNAEIEKHGDFAESNFKDYKPHATVAYVDPAKAAAYKGKDLGGAEFPVTSITIADRHGNQTDVQLKGAAPAKPAAVKNQSRAEGVSERQVSQPAAGGGEGGAGTASSPAQPAAIVPAPAARQPAAVAARPAAAAAVPERPRGHLGKGAVVTLEDGTAGVVQFAQPSINGAPARTRVRMADGKVWSFDPKELKPVQSPTVDPNSKWIGVDLDGTLAKYDGFKGAETIGSPVPAMLDRVKDMLAKGQDVRIFTARIADDPGGKARAAIEAWSQQHLGQALPITNIKNDRMTQMYDDRAVQVERNTGKIVGGGPNAEDAVARGTGEAPPVLAAPVGGKSGRDTQAGQSVVRGLEPEPNPATTAGPAQEPIRGSGNRDELGPGAKPVPAPAGNAERSAADVRLPGESTAELQERLLSKGRFARELSGAKTRLSWENATKAKLEAVTLHGAPIQVMNPDAYETIRKIAYPDEGDFAGVFLAPHEASRLVSRIRSFESNVRQRPGMKAGADGLKSLALSLDKARDTDGSLTLLRGDYDDATMREEINHRWWQQSGLRQSDAMQEMAQRPEFEDTRERLRGMGYNLNQEDLAAELVGKAMAGDPEMEWLPEQQADIVTAALKLAVDEKGPEILKNLPPSDPAMAAAIKEAREYADTAATRGRTEGRGLAEADREGALQGNRPQGRDLREAARPESGGNGGQRGVQKGGAPETKLEQFKRLTQARQGTFALPGDQTLPGMGEAVAKQDEAAAEQKSRDLTAEMRQPKGDISKAAGKMERESPLFAGTDAGGQGSLFRKTDEDTPGWQVTRTVAFRDSRPQSDKDIEAAKAHSKSENAAGALSREATLEGVRHISVNTEGMALIGKIGGVAGFPDGMTLLKDAAQEIGEAIRELAAVTPENRQQLEDLASHLGDTTANFGNVILAHAALSDMELRPALAQEAVHDWQMHHLLTGDSVVTRLNQRMMLMGGPRWLTARRVLEEDYGYAPEVASIEIPAWIAAGDHAKLGISREQGEALLARYMKEVASLRGASIAETFPKLEKLKRGAGYGDAGAKAATGEGVSEAGGDHAEENRGPQRDSDQPDASEKGSGILEKRRPTENKVGKPFGAKVGETKITLAGKVLDVDDDDPQWKKDQLTVPYLPVTDAMRKSVLTEGQPLFQKTAAPARTPTTVTTGDHDPGKSLEEAVRDIAELPERKMTMEERVTAAADAGIHKIAEGKTAIEETWDKLKGSTAGVWSAWAQPAPWTDYLASLGDLRKAEFKAALDLDGYQKELRRVAPTEREREAMTVYGEANGDPETLKRWAANAGNLPDQQYARAFAEAQNLTAAQKTVADAHRRYYEQQLKLLMDAGLLPAGATNYAMHMFATDPQTLAQMRSITDFSELASDPSFLKRRVYKSYFEAMANGEKPRTMDAGKILGAYHDMFTKTFMTRSFLRSLMYATDETDGRPLAALESRAGWTLLDKKNGPDEARILKQPKRPKDLAGYEAIPAAQLRNFTWELTDEDREMLSPGYAEMDKEAQSKLFGPDDPRFPVPDNKVLAMKGDILIHPNYVGRVSDLVTKSWMDRSDSKVAKTIKAVQKGGALAKSAILAGSLFHQVQLGVHSMEHLVNPFKLSEFKELAKDPIVKEGVGHGLNLLSVDPEGVLSDLPGMATYHRYLFRDFIPRLKATMYKHAFDRNMQRYGGAKAGTEPKLTRDEIHLLTTKQANAAFGGLDPAFFEKLHFMNNRTYKALEHLALFSPDFTKARAQFVIQGFGRFGQEQRLALLRGAAVIYAAARIVNLLLNHDEGIKGAKWAPEDALSVVTPKSWGQMGNKRLSLRTVQGDLMGLVTSPASWAYNRLNPVTLRPTIEFLTGRDNFGRLEAKSRFAKDYLKQLAPLPVQKLFTTSDEGIVSSLFQAAGLNYGNYRTPLESQAHKMRLSGIPDKPENEDKQDEQRKNVQTVEKVRDGRMTATDVWNQVNEGKLTAREAAAIVKRAGMTGLQYDVDHLQDFDDVLTIWNKADASERGELKDVVEQKAVRRLERVAKDQGDKQAGDLEAKLQDLGILDKQ